MLHSGSRGLGHQVCSDFLGVMRAAAARYGIALVDPQLAAAPLRSTEGQSYFGAMTAAANYAWANRQALTGLARETLAGVLGMGEKALDLRLVYDVAHNIAKLEEHATARGRLRVLVHRKGATRAFGPGHPELPAAYAAAGQPVIIPGDMGRCSYLLAGTKKAMQDTYGSACHGAGRLTRYLADAGAAVLIQERELTPRRLTDELTALLADRAALARMGTAARSKAWTHATDDIVAALLRAAGAPA